MFLAKKDIWSFAIYVVALLVQLRDYKAAISLNLNLFLQPSYTVGLVYLND